MKPNNKEIILSIENLNKTYGETKTINNLTFNVYKGELFGFLGINGAGKTTTLNIILSFIKPDSGNVLINNKNINDYPEYIKSQIGVVFQDSILDRYLSVREILYERAFLYFRDKKAMIKEKVQDMIKLFELEEFANKLYKTLSGGQRRRVDIARALIHSPSILFLDEPTTGLDPSSRKLVWKILNNLREKQLLTIILTTHYMEEASNCDHVIVLNKGEIVAQGTVADLKNKYTYATLKIYSKKNIKLEEYIQNSGKEFIFQNNCYLITFKNTKKINEYLTEHKHIFNDIEIIKGDMDDVFLSIVNN
ncbi:MULTISPECIES: ABC transporter ATP-binding protein [unclassified Mycoplasma]|uniref:ABC transporter ATP-binding protein n=1 Tax=unclassified Mycoplasma TaxID=2683645 RepID=UPI00211BFD9D|nr:MULTISPECIES: ABC transporter ATP-binding protein [unclassified Mycoplasma]UUM19813.1 ABC transporter ATP-binding protein [Mycoplasma sp. 1578d]UUM24797.1 ABC transporter ATP-binding protein [Mycoplasma sp. 3686d]